MESQAENRNTFLSCSDLLASQVQRVDKVRAELQHSLASSSAQEKPVLTQICQREKELSECLARFLRDGPRQVLDTLVRIFVNPSIKSISYLLIGILAWIAVIFASQKFVNWYQRKNADINQAAEIN